MNRTGTNIKPYVHSTSNYSNETVQIDFDHRQKRNTKHAKCKSPGPRIHQKLSNSNGDDATIRAKKDEKIPCKTRSPVILICQVDSP